MRLMLALTPGVLVLLSSAVAFAEQPPNSPVLSNEVVAAMQKVHRGFSGKPGYVAQYGDSITYSMAFWSAMSWSSPEEYLTAEDGLPKKPAGSRWRDTLRGARDKGAKFGNYSGWRVGNVNKAIDAALQRDKPEIAILMIGTNDISGGKVPAGYAAGLQEVIDKCTRSNCIVVLNTIPPRRGREQAVRDINQIIRQIAARNKLPLVDYHAECLRRRPGDAWDGTLISKDGVHPSGGKSHVYTDENLNDCGYALRNWLNFQMVRQLYFRVLHPQTEK